MQGGWGGWSTGNEKKLSSNHAQLPQVTCLSVAYFLSTSCGPSTPSALYTFFQKKKGRICNLVDLLKTHLQESDLGALPVEVRDGGEALEAHPASEDRQLVKRFSDIPSASSPRRVAACAIPENLFLATYNIVEHHGCTGRPVRLISSFYCNQNKSSVTV